MNSVLFFLHLISFIYDTLHYPSFILTLYPTNRTHLHKLCPIKWNTFSHFSYSFSLNLVLIYFYSCSYRFHEDFLKTIFLILTLKKVPNVNDFHMM
ncbi:hypothetical protein Lalb_Chr06g0172041 [Lupinus albus]|uniref:Uncharacterized protein n=1 Tax=Lupinus albus TaxID=3870 RepID=A0A6A4QEI4_LUPAL|nr:hypothetical protein Lalb_Chr06g0172041 [Lupinus albus]